MTPTDTQVGDQWGAESGSIPAQKCASIPGQTEAAGSSLWAIGSWLSAALDDPSVCAEMKADIREWFDGGGHVRPSLFLAEVAVERQRQISVEGRTPEHDDEYRNGELAKAAACYAAGQTFEDRHPRWRREDGPKPRIPWRLWPWGLEWWKPKTYRDNLVRSAALLVAEGDRLDRAPGGGGR